VSYVRASTDNPLGWRPNTLRLGNLQRGRRVAFRNRLRLGDPGWNCDISSGACSPCDTSSDPNCVASGADAQATTDQINLVSRYFQQANTEQIRQEQQISAGNQAGIQWPASLSAQIQQNRVDLEALLDKYNTLYRASFGQVPSIPGLNGLGIAPLLAAGIVTAIAAAIIIVIQHQLNTAGQIQVQQQQAQTQGTLSNQLAPLQQKIADAAARNDAAAVAQYTAQYNSILKLIGSNNPNPTDWSAFFQNNWGWLAAAIGGVVLVSRI